MQVFRLMDMPDKVIAFDELPERLLTGFEMIPADGFPRHWKEWLGKKKKYIQIPPEKDFMTGQVRRFTPIEEENYYFYVVDAMLQPSVEKWQEVCDYVRTHVSKETRLTERLEDMAKALAPDKISPITLEPEEVVCIKIEKEAAPLLDSSGAVVVVKKDIKVVPCDEPGCKAQFEGQWAKNAQRMHKMKAHKKEAQAIA